MKIFISADIEGCAGVSSWSETELGTNEHRAAAEQMTEEVISVCEILMEEGVEEIVVKDAHDSGKNILYDKLPEKVRIVRNWSGGPYSMITGIDKTFDGAIFIGYHSGASQSGNPLAHTMNPNLSRVKINGYTATEFLLHAYAATDFGVPVIMVSGDKMLCETVRDFNSNISTAAVKEGLGGAVISLNQKDACGLIRQKTKEAVDEIDNCKLSVPEFFEVEIEYKQHKDAYRASFYPEVEMVDSHTVRYKSKNVKDMLITNMFIM